MNSQITENTFFRQNIQEGHRLRAGAIVHKSLENPYDFIKKRKQT